MPPIEINRYPSMRARPWRFLRVAMRRQRGALAVLAAIWIGAAIAALGVIDVGNVYLVRRQLQRTADMASVAAAQTVGMAGGCATATASAQQGAAQNGYAGADPVSVACGRWTMAGGTVQLDTSGATPLNAVQVTVTQTVRHFFIGPARDVQAVATAKAVDTASFSLSTSLATLSGGAINGLLGALLGTNVSIDIATWQALASTSVRLGDLATQLGVASMNELLGEHTTVADLAGAMATVVTRNGTASPGVSAALSSIQAAANGGPRLALGDRTGAPGLLSIGLVDKQAAASATISALDALVVSAELAHGTSALDLGVALDPSSIPGVTLPLGLTAKAVILEPPVIAVGEAGTDSNGNYRTSAHAAQVRVYLDLHVSLAPLATVDLPIHVEGANGTAVLTQTQCSSAKSTSTSTILVRQTGVASVCIGADAASNLTNTTGLPQCQQPAKLATLQIPLVLPISVDVNAGTASPPSGLNLALQVVKPATLTFNSVAGDGDDFQSADANGLGSAASGLLGQLAAQLPGALFLSVNGVAVTPQVASVAQPLLQLLISALQPVLSGLDRLLVPLLQLLGVQIGVSTVHAISLSCSDAQLVN
ncbi:TadG family pilus assembly protein [Paraburkholderia sediminicola]|uniref:TadG family pilus assembly protein n=1 Tax=Paraburkholderia sediminicola TaxID=458836 RepID=UPI0038B7C041